jgi:GNAT superfamily N-acetyltransferase
MAPSTPSVAPAPGSAFETRSIARAAGLTALEGARLSREFDPFLPLFAAQTLRAGGEVVEARVGGSVCGLLLFLPDERIGTLFATGPEEAAALLRLRGPGEFFTERPVGEVVATLDLFAADLVAGTPLPPLLHAVRIARGEDAPALRDLARSIDGPLGVRWMEVLLGSGATPFLAEVDGEIAGVAWAERVRDRGRLHSLFVRPGFRGLGVGRSLVSARLRWLRWSGARRAVMEIDRQARDSRSIAERAGLRGAGPMYRVRGPGASA